MRSYHDLLQDVVDNGTWKQNRTGVATKGVFGRQLRHDLRDGFPLLTKKKVHFKSIVHELLWFISGDTNTKYLQENEVSIWDEWATKDGSLGPVYGKQWRNWSNYCDADDYKEFRRQNINFISFPLFTYDQGIDQLNNAIQTLKTNPLSRRIIVNAWNPVDLPNENMSPQQNVFAGRMALAPCHCLFQFYAEPIPEDDLAAMYSDTWNTSNPKIQELLPKYYLSLQLYQRSCDIFLGVPFNIASYALLLMMVAQQTNMIAKDFVHTFGDLHLYENHQEQAEEYLSRSFKKLPQVILNPKDSIDDYVYDDILLIGYDPLDSIKAEVAV